MNIEIVESVSMVESAKNIVPFYYKATLSIMHSIASVPSCPDERPIIYSVYVID